MVETMDLMVESSMKAVPGIVEDYGMSDIMNEIPEEKAALSDTVILIIVMIVCAAVGIVLGILAGKKSANK